MCSVSKHLIKRKNKTFSLSKMNGGLLLHLFSIVAVLLMISGTSARDQRSRPHVAGLILARCGSKGIPMKNLAKIRNESLLSRTIQTLHRSRRFTSLWVATDCNTIAHEALLCGAQVFRRSSESATDTAPSLIAVQEFLAQKTDVEVVGLFQCTSPFLATSFIHSAFELLFQGYDSVFSVSRQYKLRWHISKNGRVSASNFDPAHRPRRQSWGGELVENGMFYFISRHIVASGLLQGGR